MSDEDVLDLLGVETYFLQSRYQDVPRLGGGVESIYEDNTFAGFDGPGPHVVEPDVVQVFEHADGLDEVVFDWRQSRSLSYQRRPSRTGGRAVRFSFIYEIGPCQLHRRCNVSLRFLGVSQFLGSRNARSLSLDSGVPSRC